MIRLLHLTDTHLGAVRRLRGAPRGFRRADDHRAALVAALEPAMRGEVDAVIHSGDLFDRSQPPRPVVVDAAERLVEVARRVPVVILPGNHDRRGLLRYLPHRLSGLHVRDAPSTVDLGGVRLALVPFRHLAAHWAHDAGEVWRKGADLLVTHVSFDGARVPGFTFRASARSDTVGAAHLPPGLRWVLCGHIHPRQVVELGGARVVHPGSTERTAFSERTQTKGVVHWELGRTIAWRWVDLPSRPMVWVARPDDLDLVVPGAITRLAPGAEQLEPEVAARGGWVDAAGPPPGAGARPTR